MTCLELLSSRYAVLAVFPCLGGPNTVVPEFSSQVPCSFVRVIVEDVPLGVISLMIPAAFPSFCTTGSSTLKSANSFSLASSNSKLG